MGSHKNNEKALVRRILRGDEAAFRDFVDTYKERVSGYLFRIIPHESDREEVCQDVFVKAYYHMKGFRFESALSTWLYRIAWHAAVSHLRKTKKWRDDVPLTEKEADLVSSDSPYSASMERETTGLINDEIARLNPEERSILTLFHLLEMRISDVSHIMMKPEGTIKSELFRIRKKLKDRIKLRMRDDYPTLVSQGS